MGNNRISMTKVIKTQDLFHDVGEFHKKFGLATFGSVKPNLLPPDVQEFRHRFMQEELDEYWEALRDGDRLKAVDALVDLVYVALGTAHMHGFDFNGHWDVVQLANMAKERRLNQQAADERSKRGHVLDVVKPAGWVPPDHLPIMERAENDYVYIHENTSAE